jgi:hypothetical protein
VSLHAPSKQSEPVSDEAPRHRGNVDYVLRTAHQHHVALSSMADQKANILVGCSFLMLTLLWGQMNQDQGRANIGLIVLAVFTASSAVCALLAVMPRFKRPKQGAENVLFFGHFAEMDESAHVAELRRRLADDAVLYDTWIRDLHQLGKALYFRKYRYLRFSYQLLLTGFILGILTTVLERFVFHTVG